MHRQWHLLTRCESILLASYMGRGQWHLLTRCESILLASYMGRGRRPTGAKQGGDVQVPVPHKSATDPMVPVGWQSLALCQAAGKEDHVML